MSTPAQKNGRDEEGSVVLFEATSVLYYWWEKVYQSVIESVIDDDDQVALRFSPVQ